MALIYPLLSLYFVYIIAILLVNFSTPVSFGENTDDYIQSNSTKFDVSNYIYDINSSPFNITYSEWTSKWWQWAYSIPQGVHPAFDDTGKFCQEGQNEPVWFFPGTYQQSVIRNCEIPKGIGILFPILNSECSFIEHPKIKTKEDLINCARIIQNTVIPQYAKLNGAPIENLSKYRIQSEIFNFTLPKNNILNLPAQTTQAIADGNWVFIKPLPPGQYHLEFKGELKDKDKNKELGNASKFIDEFAGPIGWNYSTTYILNIR